MTSARYRRWMAVLLPPLLALGSFLLSGDADENSLRWKLGVGLGLCLVVGYVGKEVYWNAKKQGHPCGACGKPFQPRAFSLSLRCPHCGKIL